MAFGLSCMLVNTEEPPESPIAPPRWRDGVFDSWDPRGWSPFEWFVSFLALTIAVLGGVLIYRAVTEPDIEEPGTDVADLSDGDSV